MGAAETTGRRTAAPGKAPLGDATHYELAERWAMHHATKGDASHFPVFSGGGFFLPGRADALWHPTTIGQVEAQVAAMGLGEKL